MSLHKKYSNNMNKFWRYNRIAFDEFHYKVDPYKFVSPYHQFL